MKHYIIITGTIADIEDKVNERLDEYEPLGGLAYIPAQSKGDFSRFAQAMIKRCNVGIQLDIDEGQFNEIDMGDYFAYKA